MSEARIKFRQAVLSLSNTYLFKEMTITQLAQEAGMSRKSFYRIYHTKENLLNDCLKELVEEKVKLLRKAIINSTSSNKFESSIRAYFSFWQSKQRFLRFIVENHLELEFNDALLAGTSVLLDNELEGFSIFDEQDDDLYTLVYVQGGLNTLLFRWYCDGMVKPIDSLVENVMSVYSIRGRDGSS